MQTQTFFWEHIEDFYRDIPDWVGEDLQLSAGKLNCRLRLVDLDGVALIWMRCDARMLISEALLSDDLVVGLSLKQSPGPILGSTEVGYGHLGIWTHNRERTYTLPGGIGSLMIRVSRAEVMRMGWDLVSDHFFRPTATHHIDRLVTTCQRVSVLPHLQLLCPRDVVLHALDAVLRPFQRSDPRDELPHAKQTKADLIRDARQLLRNPDFSRGEQLDTLAERLGISRRTLFRLFREHLGMSPLAYQRLSRLHALRRALLGSNAQDSSVTRLASDLGFNHLGRLSADYKQHFLELPRDTLRDG